jgi:trans-4-hydroxy-L-proline dehydratase
MSPSPDTQIPTPTSSPKEANWTRAFFDLYAVLPLAERQARAFAYALEHEPVWVRPRERIAGQIYQLVPGSGAIDVNGSAIDPRWADFSVSATAARTVRRLLPENEMYAKLFGDGGLPGHVSWDYGPVLREGVDAMLASVEQLRAATDDPRAQEYYTCTTLALNGLLAWARHHADALARLADEETDPQQQEAWREREAICRHVPAQPARTFREAVQSFWFQYLAVMYENPFGGNGPGRLDWYLWPFLRDDLAAGRATLDDARNLITELFVKLDERIHDADGWVEAIVVGGRNADGSSAINPLSSIMVECIIALKQTHPSVYVRLHDGAPQDFVDLSARYIVESGNRGQVYGDDAVIAALVADGTPIEDARHWGAGGCMEVGVQGASGDLLFAFAHNVALTFELVLNGGRRLLTGEQVAPGLKTLTDYASFEELYGAFERELEREMSILLRRLDIYVEHYASYRPSFLLSSMVHDCLERGRAINDGGARYPHYGGSGVGIPNVGDSLYALRRAVFDDKRFSAAEVLAALQTNFEGHAALRAYLRGLPKYGSGNPDATGLVDRVLGSFAGILRRHTNPRGGHARAIILGFVWVVQHGLQVGATPDGRGAGRPLAHGLSPQSGAAADGITTAIRDATSLSLERASGGGAMMWDIDSFWATPEFVRPVLETYVRCGGHIFQGNCTSIEELLAARANPGEHRDVMVRVGGYSARFVTLSPEAQDEIISRCRFGRA